MKLFNWIFVFIVAAPSFAFSGAVSAGGFVAPKAFECLFVNPQTSFEPLNFTVYNLGNSHKEAALEQYSASLGQSVWRMNLSSLSEQSHGETTTYVARSSNSEIRVSMDLRKPVSDSKIQTMFTPLFRFQGAVLVDGVKKFKGQMQFRGKSFSGVCAEELFITYGSTSFR